MNKRELHQKIREAKNTIKELKRSILEIEKGEEQKRKELAVMMKDVDSFIEDPLELIMKALHKFYRMEVNRLGRGFTKEGITICLSPNGKHILKIHICGAYADGSTKIGKEDAFLYGHKIEFTEDEEFLFTFNSKPNTFINEYIVNYGN
ncbi:hypothetical protein [Tenacibaculum phage Larrie]|nr:hypothetical protein [Tenacibaculum phage Larrie]